MMTPAEPTPMNLRRPRMAMKANPSSEMNSVAPTRSARHVPHVITVTSGKGGVGKTNITANLAWQLRQMRRRVLVLDADLGLANIDIILGLQPEFNMGHVLSGEKTLQDILTKGPAGIRVLPASSGVSDAVNLSDTQKMMLLEQMESLQEDYDYLLIDSGAGIAENVIYFNLAAQTIVVVVTPEPTSLTDAYALIKVMAGEYRQTRFNILANDVVDEAEGEQVYRKLLAATDRFLTVSLDYLGCVPHDNTLRDSVRMQRPVSEVYPEGAASRALRQVARSVTALQNDPLKGDLGLLWRNVLMGEGAA